MSSSELCKVKSRLHLPDHVIKFIQKRYSSLLLGENTTTPIRPVTVLTNNKLEDTTEYDLRDVVDELAASSSRPPLPPLPSTLINQNDLIETTELTVIKDVFMAEDTNNKLKTTRIEEQTESESSVSSSPSSSSSSYDQNSPNHHNLKEIVKVDEETLYIVEKRRRNVHQYSVNNTLASTQETTATTPVSLFGGNDYIAGDEIATAATVDSEIRKNFELKPKEKKKTDQQISSSTNVSLHVSSIHNNVVTSSCLPAFNNPSLPPTPPPILVQAKERSSQDGMMLITNQELTSSIVAANQLARMNGRSSVGGKIGVKKMIDDLKLSIDEFNKYFQMQQQQQSQQIQTEINDYQLHFFKVRRVLIF